MRLAITFYILAFGFAAMIIKVILLESIISDKKYKVVILYSLAAIIYSVLFLFSYSTVNEITLQW